ncbi:MAG: hypothetical protein ACI9RV_002389, partial [Glaciecola sp.]
DKYTRGHLIEQSTFQDSLDDFISGIRITPSLRQWKR